MNLIEFDKNIRNQFGLRLCGIDEAGRGPLAGPVVAAAVMFDENIIIEGIDDSKKLSERKRKFLFDKIINSALNYGFGICSIEEIEEINILNASLKAMKDALNNCCKNDFDIAIIDGNRNIDTSKSKCIVGADGKSFSVAAASILAKVIRDEIMNLLDKKFPIYNWKKNKGYGTREHIEVIIKFGITEFHRRSFLNKIMNNTDRIL